MSSSSSIMLASPQKRQKKQKKPNSTQDILHNISRVAQKVESKFRPSIYRVPMNLRNLNKRAYTPSLVSIGPLHCKDQHLKTPIQDIKMYYVNSFLGRMTTRGSDDSKLERLNKLIEEMKPSLLSEARKCYAAEVESELDEEMLVIDGCFVLEVLYRHYKISSGSSGFEANDPIFYCPLTFVTVQRDLLLLENQLPFSALNNLFCLAEDINPNSSTPEPRLINYVCSYFQDMMNSIGSKSTKSDATNCWLLGKCFLLQSEEKQEDSTTTSGTKSDATNCRKCVRLQSEEKQEGSYHHILHFVLKHVLLEETEQTVELGSQSCINFGLCCKSSEPRPSASELVHAGVKFEGCNSFEVKFSEGKGLFGCCRFRIPNLTIDDSTELFFRNLIAFEQCFPGDERRFTSYASLMDQLINTAKDVEVLEKAGVMVISLGCRQEAVNLFNKLCKETVGSSRADFTEQHDRAARYAERCWPAALAHVRREYFATPWTTIAFAVAFIAFGITVTQFIRSFLR